MNKLTITQAKVNVIELQILRRIKFFELSGVHRGHVFHGISSNLVPRALPATTIFKGKVLGMRLLET